jgi:hypothetical protein
MSPPGVPLSAVAACGAHARRLEAPNTTAATIPANRPGDNGRKARRFAPPRFVDMNPATSFRQNGNRRSADGTWAGRICRERWNPTRQLSDFQVPSRPADPFKTGPLGLGGRRGGCRRCVPTGNDRLQQTLKTRSGNSVSLQRDGFAPGLNRNYGFGLHSGLEHQNPADPPAAGMVLILPCDGSIENPRTNCPIGTEVRRFGNGDRLVHRSLLS